MRDTLDIECLMQAINEYSEAKYIRDRERDAYEGMSWGYHGSHIENELAKKAAQVEDTLRSVVQRMVQESLEAKDTTHDK